MKKIIESLISFFLEDWTLEEAESLIRFAALAILIWLIVLAGFLLWSWLT